MSSVTTPRELLSPLLGADESEQVPQEVSLRPSGFDDYVGQSKVKENLKTFILAAQRRGDALDHCLLAGPPGLGKTTLAHIVAKSMGSQLHTISAPVLDKKGDLAAILTNLQPRDVLFIDEIHRLHASIEEVLYSAMEDFKLDIIIGQGPAARTVRLDLPPFTLVGATTRTGALTNPLRDRFGVQFRLEFYAPEELCQIVERSAKILKIPTTSEGALEMARRSRGTPRIANRILRRVRDFAQVRGTGAIDLQAAREGLKLLEVDARGLDWMDHKLLMAIHSKFSGGPVGIDSLAAALGEERATLEEVYEPYLLQEGYLMRTPRGRILGPRGVEIVGEASTKWSSEGQTMQMHEIPREGL